MKNVDQKSARLVRHETVPVLLHQLRRLGHLARYLEPREMGMFAFALATSTILMVLSRFGAAPLIAQCAAKEMSYGHSQDG